MHQRRLTPQSDYYLFICIIKVKSNKNVNIGLFKCILRSQVVGKYTRSICIPEEEE